VLYKLKALIKASKPKQKILFSIPTSFEPDNKEREHNNHIREYLRYYLALGHSPYYAVMISGVWGIGKTYLVKNLLKDLLNDTPYSYISLYGMDSIDAIDSALYQSLHPLLTSKGAKIAGRASKALLKYARIDNSINVKDFMKLGNDRLYVFDDIERSPLKPDILLGYINEMVEHDGCKVLIIGNEQKLLTIDAYRETREKLIGRTLEVQPEIQGAFDHFVAELSSPTAINILRENSTTVTSVVLEASATNLRVLQQTIWDFERTARLLDKKHLESTDGIKTLVETFFAIGLEVKAGFLTQEHIMERPDSLIRAMMRSNHGDPELAIDRADKRFSQADLYNPILSADFLCDLLFKGVVNQNSLLESLNNSKYYVDVSSEAAWRTVWHGFERTEQEFDAALTEMERQFTTREFSDPGVLLHIVGLRCWLADIGELNLTREAVFEQSREYVTAMYESGKLAPGIRDDFGGRSYEGYAGLGIREQGTKDFSEFIQFLNNHQSLAAIRQYPEKAEKLLNDMELNAGLFLQQICPTNDTENIYAYTPLLASIPPIKFVERVIILDGASKRKIIMALNLRYSHGNLERYLSDETKWLLEVYSELRTAVSSLRPLARWSISSALDYYLKPIVNLVESENNGGNISTRAD
jgi:hypothetical protein